MELRMTEDNGHIKAEPHSQSQVTWLRLGVDFETTPMALTWFWTGQCPCASGSAKDPAYTWTLASAESGQGHGSFFKIDPQSQPSFLEFGCAVTLLCVHSLLFSSLPWCILSCFPHFHGAMFLFFLEISPPGFFFAEKLIF